MKAIWKEFFRLKREEIQEFYKNNRGIEWVIPVISFTLVTIFIILPLHIFKNELRNLLTCVSFLVMIFTYFCMLLRVLMNWLKSNWKQAKINVEAK